MNGMPEMFSGVVDGSRIDVWVKRRSCSLTDSRERQSKLWPKLLGHYWFILCYGGQC